MNKNITLLSLYASSSRYDFFILKDELQKNDSGHSVVPIMADSQTALSCKKR